MRRARGTVPVVKLACKQCGTEFYVKDHETKDYPNRPARKYCSKACGTKARHGNGPGWIDQGYLYRTVRGKTKAEHRLVMERKIGRSLKSHETVHHKDGNRLNNDPSNLELWSSRHGRGQRVADKIEFCRDFLAEYGIHANTVTASEYMSGIAGLV